MASRVNYMVVAGGETTVAYRRWGAYSVYEQLDRGPEQTLHDLGCDSADGGGPAWDDVMADAGVLIDVDAKRLTFFATESVGEVAVNRAVLRRLAACWTGWEISWAYQGVHDLWPEIAAWYDRHDPPSPHRWMLNDRDWTDEADWWEYEGTPTPNAHIDCDLVSVRTTGGVAHWLYERWGWHPAWAGPGLLDKLPPGSTGPMRYVGIPVTGLHIDVVGRWVGVWNARWLHGTWDALRALWPGWTVRNWDDGYEQHVAVLDGTVVLPVYDGDAALAALDDPHP